MATFDNAQVRHSYQNGVNPLPLDGECHNPEGGVDDDKPDEFAITIDVIKVKRGEVELMYSQ